MKVCDTVRSLTSVISPYRSWLQQAVVVGSPICPKLHSYALSEGNALLSECTAGVNEKCTLVRGMLILIMDCWLSTGVILEVTLGMLVGVGS